MRGRRKASSDSCLSVDDYGDDYGRRLKRETFFPAYCLLFTSYFLLYFRPSPHPSCFLPLDFIRYPATLSKPCPWAVSSIPAVGGASWLACPAESGKRLVYTQKVTAPRSAGQGSSSPRGDEWAVSSIWLERLVYTQKVTAPRSAGQGSSSPRGDEWAVSSIWLERLVYTQKVTGSSPVPPIRLTRGPVPPIRLTRGPVPPIRLTRGPVPPIRLTRGPVPPIRLTRGPVPPIRLTRGPVPLSCLRWEKVVLRCAP